MSGDVRGLCVKGEEKLALITVDISGENVVDAWGGYEDEAQRQQPCTKNTVVHVLSSILTNSLASLAIFIPTDRGLLDIKERELHHWPRVCREWKARYIANVRHLLVIVSLLPIGQYKE
ncbi:hypothetical protein J3458_008904 [Metarhizium acridum]|uniref:uncharacterized protein n=1 Tax=Metarhizium acridum TaxID=92637 RepID=UPI001C6C4F76|nr:hypothetical protein J3458_008904 [Metarhizium acridum]